MPGELGEAAGCELVHQGVGRYLRGVGEEQRAGSLWCEPTDWALHPCTDIVSALAAGQ